MDFPAWFNQNKKEHVSSCICIYILLLYIFSCSSPLQTIYKTWVSMFPYILPHKMQPSAPAMALLIRSQAFQGFSYAWLVLGRDASACCLVKNGFVHGKCALMGQPWLSDFHLRKSHHDLKIPETHRRLDVKLRPIKSITLIFCCSE